MALKDKIQLNKVTHSVRASQAVLQYGVGAMVDFPEQTLMTAAPEYWGESIVAIHDERLEKALHVDFFGMPGSKDDGRYQNGVAYSRFPEWYFCPKCRKFQPLKEWIREYNTSPKLKKANENDPYMVKRLRCTKCFQELVVARIVVACGHGHIDDFPWVKWVHAKNSAGAKRVCESPQLRFTTSASSTEGLEGLSVTCMSCNARATLRGAFDKNALRNLDEKTGYVYDFQCTGRHPWKNVKEKCGEYPHVLQRGGSSVYFPISVSSLVIPPYSSQLTSKIQNSVAFSDLKKAIRESIKTLTAMNIASQENKDLAIKAKLVEYAEIIAKEIGRGVEQVKPILERRWNSTEDTEYTTTSLKYRAEEYVALNGEVTVEEKNGEFIREATDISEYKIPCIKSVSLIHKVREVQALLGFSRLEPIGEDEAGEDKIRRISIKEPDTNWYPGYDVRGEGIFIEFDEDEINKWRTNNPYVELRVAQINENYKKSYYGSKRERVISSKFLLIHTIAHLLMKQLSFECGYNIASLKERIYCGEEIEGRTMSGILIYTASGDSEGTMGGLVRQGRSDTFPAIFKKAISSALTCSNDPVCSLSMGQGRDSLNLSACYSCTLVPETSCEEFNVFLDRGVVVGTFEHPEMGFYSQYATGEEGKSIVSAEVSNQSVDKSRDNRIIVTNYGIDLRNVQYTDIWNNILQFSSNESEKNLLKELISCSDAMACMEKPYQSGTFQIGFGGEIYGVDLIWKDKKVMLFAEENYDEYNLAANNTDWKCFLLSSEGLTVKMLVDELGG